MSLSRNRAKRVAFAVVATMALSTTAACGGSRLDHDTLEAAFRSGATASPVAGEAVGSGDVATSTDGGPTGTASGTGTSTSTGKGSKGTGTGTSSTTGSGSTSSSTGSGSGSTGAGAPAGTAKGRSCTGNEKPIAIASVGEQSGVAGATLMNGPQTVAAWVAWINDNGGLACHQLKYYIGDAKGDPAKNASLTQQYVEQDGVVAFVQNDGALSGSGGRDYLVKNKIPVIGGDGGDQAFYEHPNFYPQVASGDVAILALNVALANVLTPDQKAHFGIVTCLEAAQCTNAAKKAPGYAKKAGMKLVYSGTASITQPDYTSVCLNAQKAGAQAIIMALDGNSMSRFVKSCKSVNYNPLFGTGESATTPSMVDDPNLNGMLIASLAAPWTDNSNASIAQMNAVLGQYAPGVANSGQAHLGWASAMLLQAASKYFPAKDVITSDDINKAMSHIKNNDLGGLTGPLTFTAGKPATPVACSFTMAIKDGQWVGLNNNRRGCV